jgi:transposase, IS5 family
MIAGFSLAETATFAAMRHHFQPQPDLQITPIEKIRLLLKSRDELPPILAGLQWLWMHPTLKVEILALLEAKILVGKQATGRSGTDLWQILVLDVVRLGLDAGWDRMEHVANHDTHVRQMLGVLATPWGRSAKVFGHQTLRDNVALLDEVLLQQINGRVAAAGRMDPVAEEGVFPLRAAHPMNPESQAAAQRGVGPSAADRHRPASIDPGP